MTTLIWDFDGTLYDSYGAITKSVEQAFEFFHIAMDTETIRNTILQTSVRALLNKMEEENGFISHEILNFYSERLEENNALIQPYPGTAKILSFTKKHNIRNMIFTHRNHSAMELLERDHLLSYFSAIITSDDGYPRKPAPDALLFLKKTSHLKETFYYIGDRTIDMECAANANMPGILIVNDTSFIPEVSKEMYRIKDLLELKNLLKEG